MYLALPKPAVAAVIGKEGANVKELQTKTGAKFHVEEKSFFIHSAESSGDRPLNSPTLRP